MVAQIRRQDLVSVRTFAREVRLTSFPLSSITDQALLAMIGDAIRNCSLVVLSRADGSAVAQDSTAEQRQLVREIERRTHRRLSNAGRHYKLVADQDLTRLPDRNSYEVVPHASAVQVLDELAKSSGADKDLSSLLRRAGDVLASDWRPPLFPNGVVLLRRSNAPSFSSSVPDDPITPSRMKAMLRKPEWIEIEAVNEAGHACAGRYEIELPDGTVVTGDFGDGGGLWANHDIDPGQCKLRLLDVHEPVGSGAAPSSPDDDVPDEPPSPAAPAGPPEVQTALLSLVFVDEQGKSVEGLHYELKFNDGSQQEGTTDKNQLRIEEAPKGPCTLSLRNATASAA